MIDFSQVFQMYLVPFAIGVPVALLLIFFGATKWSQRLAVPPAHVASDTMLEPERDAVLVVDDSAVPRAKLKKLFEGAGYRVETAGDGQQALDMLAKFRPTVIVTDLEMPVMDGFELIAAVQGNMDTENIPLIAITGHDEMHGRVNDAKGLYGIFKKPWNDRDLLKRVGDLCFLAKK
jgi:CheY-like chemotaxis protein